jgi:nucleotide-binding universal stress UspA family protein
VLTEPVRTDLIVARVYPWDPSEAGEQPALAELDQAARSVGGRPSMVANDAAAPGLQDLAAELGADLLIVGSDSSDGVHRAAAGAVGLQLLRGSPCAVAIAPRGFARRYAPDIRTIAVGYDGSDEATGVLREAAELAQALHAGLRVITISPGEDRPPGELGDRLFGTLAALPAAIESRGVLRSGEPAAVLLDEAAREADLLAVGSRRHGPVRRALLGSVSAELVHQAPCPILVAPRGTIEVAPPLAAVVHG